MARIVCYHGTPTKENADAILREGFMVKTYFAKKNLMDAIIMGGPYVFSVVFDESGFKGFESEDGWQFWLREPLGPEHILALNYIPYTTLYENKPLIQEVFEEALKESK